MGKGEKRGRPRKSSGGKGAATAAYLGGGGDGGGDDPLGPRRPPTRSETKHPWTNQLAYIQSEVMKTMYRHDGSAIFKNPVNPRKLGILNYYEFIKNPMDMGCVRERLTNRYYKCSKECIHDLIQMFANCYFYNHPESPVVKLAKDLEKTMVRKLMDMPLEEEVIPEGQRIRTTSRRSSTGTVRSDGGDDLDCSGGVGGGPPPASPSAQSDATSSSEKTPLRRSIRMPKPRGGKELIPPETEDTTSVDSSGSSSSSDEDEDGPNMDGGAERMMDQPEVVDLDGEGEDIAGGGGGNRQSHGGSSHKKTVDNSKLAATFLEKGRERRRKRMELLQRQMRCINEQMKALEREEKEDAKFYKAAAIPSTSTGVATPSSSGGKNPKKKESDGKGRASSASTKRKTGSPLGKPAPKKNRSSSSTSAKESSSSTKPKQMTPNELAQLRAKIAILEDAGEMEEILEIVSCFDDIVDEIEEAAGEAAINYGALPAATQWQIWGLAEKTIKNLRKRPAPLPLGDTGKVQTPPPPDRPSHEDRESPFSELGTSYHPDDSDEDEYQITSPIRSQNLAVEIHRQSSEQPANAEATNDAVNGSGTQPFQVNGGGEEDFEPMYDGENDDDDDDAILDQY